METKFVVIALSLAWGFWEARMGVANRRKASGREMDRGSYLLLYLSVSISIAAASFASIAGVHPLSHEKVFLSFGLCTMVGGFVFRYASMRILADHFTHRVTILDGHRLIKSGPYRWIRHPSYLGQIVIMIGIGAALTDAWSLGIASIPVVGAVVSRILVEERVLLAHFGDEYAAYMKKTWRLVPFVW